MKFTKEDACKELTSKLQPKVEKIEDWERTIKEHVDNLLALVGESYEGELDDFVTKALPMFETTNGFLRKKNSDVAQSFNKQIEDLKKQIPPKQEPPKPDGNEQLLQRIAELEKKMSEEESTKKVSAIRTQLFDKIKAGGVKNEEWINSMLDKSRIEESTDVEKESASYVEMYNKFFSQLPDDPSKVTPKSPREEPTDKANKAIAAAAELVKGSLL